MDRIGRSVLGWVIASSIACVSCAQGNSTPPDPGTDRPPAQEASGLALSPIAALVGEWEGTGTYNRGPGNTETVRITEKATWRFDGKAILVEGHGSITDPDGTERTVHDALGVIRTDPETGKLTMHAFTPDNPAVKAEFEQLASGQLRWGFEVPGGRVRFTITCTATSLNETGEFSRDGGETWMGFFEMDLVKVEKAEE